MRSLLYLCLAACSFEPRATGGDPVDDAQLPPDACTSFASQLDICAQPAGDDLTLDGVNQLDTATGKLTDAGGATLTATTKTVTLTTGVQVEALFVRTLTLHDGARLRGTGNRPLAIIASREVVLENGAVIDVGSGGAGARLICPSGPAVGDTFGNGAGGGGGAGFGGAGGDGGDGNSDFITTIGRGGRGGMASTQPEALTGGCPGAAGGAGDDPGGVAGLGGGALYVAAAKRITIGNGGGINAGGGGGGGGAAGNGGDAGGGGGGSGGMIFLEAPQIHSSGFVGANGGGGGEGSGGDVAGRPGSAAIDASRAAGGGPGGGTGATGGAGGGGAVRAGEKTMDFQPGGGGGGGGGVGFIHVLSAEPQLPTISPAAS